MDRGRRRKLIALDLSINAREACVLIADKRYLRASAAPRFCLCPPPLSLHSETIYNIHYNVHAEIRSLVDLGGRYSLVSRPCLARNPSRSFPRLPRGLSLPQVTELLEEVPELTLGQAGNEIVADLVQAGTGAEVGETEVADALADVERTGVLKVVGSLSSYMMRLGDEYTKSLQNINPHTQEYIRRLKDESVVVELATKVQGYYERQGEMGTAAELALLQVWNYR